MLLNLLFYVWCFGNCFARPSISSTFLPMTHSDAIAPFVHIELLLYWYVKYSLCTNIWFVPCSCCAARLLFCCQARLLLNAARPIVLLYYGENIWCSLCTKPTCLVGLLVLAHWNRSMLVHPHIIPILGQPVFGFSLMPCASQEQQILILVLSLTRPRHQTTIYTLRQAC